MASPLRVVQLSDLHFSSREGGYAWRDTTASFAAVAERVVEARPDMVVVTGDLANEGKPDEYEMAGDALAALDLPVYCLAGNHDSTDAFHAHLPRPNVSAPRTLRVGEWLFLFGDSNAGGMAFDPDHGWVDTPGRMHDANGSLTTHEISWLTRQLATSHAAHAMLWLHHPPGSSRFFEQPEYDAQVAAIADSTERLRAVAAGHAHTGVTMTVGGIPSHLCPSTGLSLDFLEMVMMPPGYREFVFWPDGSIETDVVWVEDERWSRRHRLPPGTGEYLAGKITHEEFTARLADGT